VRSRARPGLAPFLLALLLIAAGLAAGSAMPVPPRPGAAAAHAAPPPPREAPALETLAIIAGSNFRVGALLLGGVASLGAMGTLQLLWIGFGLGRLMGAAVGTGVPAGKVALLVAPHAVLELAAFAVLAALQFEAAVLVYRKLRHDDLGLAPGYAAAAARQAALGLAMIAAAALVEVFVTGSLAARIQ